MDYVGLLDSNCKYQLIIDIGGTRHKYHYIQIYTLVMVTKFPPHIASIRSSIVVFLRELFTLGLFVP